VDLVAAVRVGDVRCVRHKLGELFLRLFLRVVSLSELPIAFLLTKDPHGRTFSLLTVRYPRDVACLSLLVAIPITALLVLYRLSLSRIQFVIVLLLADEIALHEPAFDFHDEVRRAVGTLRKRQRICLVEAAHQERGADNEGRKEKSRLEHWRNSI